MSRTVDACPRCGSSSLTCNAVGGGRQVSDGTGRYRCCDCGLLTDKLEQRNSRQDHTGRRGLAGKLAEASPDEVSAE